MKARNKGNEDEKITKPGIALLERVLLRGKRHNPLKGPAQTHSCLKKDKGQ